MSKGAVYKFYKTKAWTEVRGYCMIRDQWLCQDCLAKGIYTPAKEVHHIIEVNETTVNDPSIALNPENCISLCKSCHAARHGAKQRRYTVDKDGRVTSK